MINIKLPEDLTPAERARLKLYSHFAIIAIVNGVLAGFALLTSGAVIGWQTILACVISQAGLALLDGLKKYYSASGELPLSTMLDLARQEVAAKAPPAPAYTPNELALQQSFNTYMASQQISPPGQSTVSIHPAPDATIDRLNTLPNIAAVKPQ